MSKSNPKALRKVAATMAASFGPSPYEVHLSKSEVELNRYFERGNYFLGPKGRKKEKKRLQDENEDVYDRTGYMPKTAGDVDWKAFEKKLKSPAFRQEVLATTKDPKLKKYVQNYGGSLSSKELRAYVQSSTNDDHDYQVKALSGGRYSCNCKDWQYNHSVKGGDCRHVKRYKMYLQGLIKASSAPMNLPILKSFRTELEKVAARRGLKEVAKLLRSGNIEKAHALAKAPGVIKNSPAGSQIRDLGKGSEGLATLVAHPEHGLAARKLYDPQGMASPEMIARKEQAGKAIKNPNVAQFYGAAKTPQGGTMHLNEYVPGSTTRASSKNPDIRAVKAQSLKAVRKAGFHGAQDIRPGNMITTPQGQHKVIDYLPSQKGEFARPSTMRKLKMPEEMVAPTDKGDRLVQSGSLKLSPGQLKAQQFRGAQPTFTQPPKLSPAQQAAPTAVNPNRKKPVAPQSLTRPSPAPGLPTVKV